ncbi:toprim domain-containing protein [Telluribacter sp. SYSU D00476]|uniref:toprim domain-containing protein n=1 Tax=Telluribacter sp. SYSU D00476 TaxID=2811430 RepID=UPI001FF5FC60|nr:toprim domain-containing protein [Telluribacter sp. SYSU D00476]
MERKERKERAERGTNERLRVKKKKNMNAKHINQQYSLVEFLTVKGFQPVSIKGSDYWYRSMIRETEQTASFKVDSGKNLWYDHGMGKGGTLIDLACLLFQTDDVKRVMREIKSSFFSFHPHPTNKPISARKSKGLRVIGNHELRDPKLMEYLQSRGIAPEVGSQFCTELYYENKGRLFRSIAFENVSQGYELSGPGFKSSLAPKDISFLDNGRAKLSVFEGFMDFLSYQMLPVFHVADSDYLILNSLSFLSRTPAYIARYERLFLFLDNDKAGMKAASQLRVRHPQVIDMSVFYSGHKDLNDFLTQTPIAYEQRASDSTIPETGPKASTRPFRPVQ